MGKYLPYLSHSSLSLSLSLSLCWGRGVGFELSLTHYIWVYFHFIGGFKNSFGITNSLILKGGKKPKEQHFKCSNAKTVCINKSCKRQTLIGKTSCFLLKVIAISLSNLLFPSVTNLPLDWTDRLGSTHLLASSWCFQSKAFCGYSVQNSCLKFELECFL